MQNQSKANLSMKTCLAVGFHLRLLCYSQMYISYNVFTLRKKRTKTNCRFFKWAFVLHDGFLN